MPKPIYDSRDLRCKNPFGALASGQEAAFSINLPKTVAAESVTLRLYPIDDWEQPILFPMQLSGADLTGNTYCCRISAPEPALYAYYFEVQCGKRLYNIKRQPDNTGALAEGGPWQLTVYSEKMCPPACLREGVLYQIFPDRFHNSGKPKENVPGGRELRQDWGALPNWRPNAEGKVTNSDYFGGDLAGITEKLDYLESLGITAIYLNPIFEAHSNHRYNTANYLQVDPLLGDNEDFRVLCAEAKERGISIILDGVFSHTGSDSVYFNRERRYGDGGAYNDPHSPYSSWYRFRHFPHDYESWWGFETLPNVEETDPSYLEFICGEKGVLHHWMALGAAGFRLDVADELPDLFLDTLHARVKKENPDAVVLGEVWEDASNKVSYGERRRYLLGGQLDTVMNYPFKDSLLAYMRDGNGEAFLTILMQILENYPPAVIPALMNSLSTHDTARAITVLAGEPMGEHGREWQEAHHYLPLDRYQQGKRLLILAAILQYGLPGIPCIYYGDEVGLSGYRDPFNRVCYPWGYEDTDLLTAFQALGAIRRDYPIFSKADFTPLVFSSQLCAFQRSADGYHLVFAINRSDKKGYLPLSPTRKLRTLFRWGSYSDGYLNPYSGVILLWKD